MTTTILRVDDGPEPLTFADLMRFAKGGCATCRGAGFVSRRTYAVGSKEHKAIASREGHARNLPCPCGSGKKQKKCGCAWNAEPAGETLRCHCTNEGLDRAGLAMRAGPRGMYLVRAAVPPGVA